MLAAAMLLRDTLRRGYAFITYDMMPCRLRFDAAMPLRLRAFAIDATMPATATLPSLPSLICMRYAMRLMPLCLFT